MFRKCEKEERRDKVENSLGSYVPKTFAWQVNIVLCGGMSRTSFSWRPLDSVLAKSNNSTGPVKVQESLYMSLPTKPISCICGCTRNGRIGGPATSDRGNRRLPWTGSTLRSALSNERRDKPDKVSRFDGRRRPARSGHQSLERVRYAKLFELAFPTTYISSQHISGRKCIPKGIR